MAIQKLVLAWLIVFMSVLSATVTAQEDTSPFAQAEKLPGDLSDLWEVVERAKGEDDREAKAADVVAKGEIPSLEDQASALKRVEEVFPRATAGAETVALVENLFSVGSDEKAAVMRYALLRYAGTLALESRRVELAIRAADALDRNYDFDVLAMKAAILGKLVGRKTAERILPLALEYFDQSVSSDHYLVAARYGVIAFKAAKELKRAEAIQDVRALAKRLKELRTAYENIKPVVAKLKSQPNDSEANLTVGGYFVFSKGDFDSGLHLLAKGGHPIAKLELSDSLTAADKKEIADGWWSIAQEQKDVASKQRILDRAVDWYQMALPDLRGLTKLRVEKRLRTHRGLQVEATAKNSNRPAEDRRKVAGKRRKPEVNEIKLSEARVIVLDFHDHGRWSQVDNAIMFVKGYAQFEIPRGATTFAALVSDLTPGDGRSVQLLVKIDKQAVFQTDPISGNKSVPILVRIPRGARVIEFRSASGASYHLMIKEGVFKRK